MARKLTDEETKFWKREFEKAELREKRYLQFTKQWRDNSKDRYEFQKTWGYAEGFGENNLINISLDVFE